jgi:hypothetical protein
VKLDSLVIQCPKCGEFNCEPLGRGFHLLTGDEFVRYGCKSCRHWWDVTTKIGKRR